MNQTLKTKVTIGDILHSKCPTLGAKLFSFMEKMNVCCMEFVTFYCNCWYDY